MSLIKKLSNMLSSKEKHTQIPETTEFEYYFDKLYQEIKKSGKLRNYFSQFKLSDTVSYQTIKGLKNEEKISFIFWLTEERLRLNKNKNRLKPYRSNDEVRLKAAIVEKLLSALFRQNIGFSDEDFNTLFHFFYNNREIVRFNDWPLTQLAQQIERQVKKEPISNALKDTLSTVLSWKVMKQSSWGWGADVEKVGMKLREIIAFQNGSAKVLPFILHEDQFGTMVNNEITQFAEEVKETWFTLFRKCSTASTGKPSQKFLKETQALAIEIGNAKFKRQMQQWLLFLTKMELISTPIVHTYANGQEYHYTTHEFLNDKNTKLLKGLVWTMSKFHDKKTLAILSNLTMRCFKKIPGVGPTAAALGNACIYTLANSKGLDGISHLSRLKSKIQQTNTKKLLQKYINESAKKLGITPAEVEELSIPDYGLVNGKRSYAFDDYTSDIEVIGVGRVTSIWKNPDGKTQKSVPAFVKNSATLNKKLKAAKADIKEIQKYVTAQRDRIDNIYLQNRSWTLEQFLPLYIEHGLVGFIGQKLIWQFEEGDKKETGIFINQTWQNLKGATIDWLSKNTKVTLWHPIFADKEAILGWRNRLEHLSIQQPMKQAYREIYLLTAAEENTQSYSNRMAAHILKQHQFNSLAKLRNWTYNLVGAWDHGLDCIARKKLSSYNIQAEYWLNEILDNNDAYNDTGVWLYMSTDQVRFTTGHGIVDLKDVPPIVFSEIMRDVDMFVGVASVGNDPQWADNGGLPQFRTYWQSYSFGDLSELAKTRKEVLQRLLPRLKIRDVAKIDGRFLVVKGKIRTYKIHIGSTNILMTPNDQYLCIVPSRGKESTSNLFLPFEGDRGLSIVLSKAFLLVEDDKITDRTITSQLKF